MAASGTLSIGAKFLETISADADGFTLPQSIDEFARLAAQNLDIAFTSGTGNNQIDQVWGRSIDLAISTVESLDLQALPGLLSGASKSFDKIKFMLIYNTASTAGQNVTIDGDISNAFVGWKSVASDEVLGPGDFILRTSRHAGFTVDATHKVLSLDPGASAKTVIVVLAGIAS